MSPPRVMHVRAPARFGGLERVVGGMAVGRLRTGAAVEVAALLEDGAAEPGLVSALQTAGVPVHSLRAPSRGYLKQLEQLRALISRTRPDILHSHGYMADVFVALMGRRTSVARATTVHGFTGGGRKNRAYEWMQRRAFRHFDAVVAVSNKLRAELAADGIPEVLLSAIPNAYWAAHPPLSASAARRQLGISPSGFSIGWVGRLSAEKGPDLFLEALALLSDEQWLATVVGDGRERAALEALAQARGIRQRITFTGAVADAPALLRAFDLLVISSRTEGTPMSLLEAMATGVPIVTTAVGGIPDVVTDREALLVPPADPKALASAIRQALRNSNAMAQRATRAENEVKQRFSLDVQLSRYEDIYSSIARANHALPRT